MSKQRERERDRGRERERERKREIEEEREREGGGIELERVSDCLTDRQNSDVKRSEWEKKDREREL